MKPNTLNFRSLLKDGRSMSLKENIIEHFDFEAVTPGVWRLLYSWYSADWCVMRLLKRDRVNAFGCVLDLYPEIAVPGAIIGMLSEDNGSL
jgi:hypothetical protein